MRRFLNIFRNLYNFIILYLFSDFLEIMKCLRNTYNDFQMINGIDRSQEYMVHFDSHKDFSPKNI